MTTTIVFCATLIILLWTVVGAWCIARMWDGWQKAEAERERAQRHREQVNRDLVAAVVALSRESAGAHIGAILATKTDTRPEQVIPGAPRRMPVS